MKCQGKRSGCPNVASHVRDIPNLGESLCFCVDCVNQEIMHYGKDFGWYHLTLEREEQETVSEEMLETWKVSMQGIDFFRKKK
jgi:hypothetical protein